MPRPRYAESYPPELHAALTTAARAPREPIPIEFATPKAAQAYRFTIYAYIQALTNSIRRLGQSSHSSLKLREDLSLIKTLKFTIQGRTLTILPAELDATAIDARRFLATVQKKKGLQEPTPQPEPLEPLQPLEPGLLTPPPADELDAIFGKGGWRLAPDGRIEPLHPTSAELQPKLQPELNFSDLLGPNSPDEPSPPDGPSK